MALTPETVDLLGRGGSHVARGIAHRGVLTTDERRFLDHATVLAAVERELGVTVEEVRSVYRQGRTSEAQRELRGRIDARLLAIAEDGGHMTELARVLGWKVDNRGSYTMSRALARARAAQQQGGDSRRHE